MKGDHSIYGEDRLYLISLKQRWSQHKGMSRKNSTRNRMRRELPRSSITQNPLNCERTLGGNNDGIGGSGGKSC